MWLSYLPAVLSTWQEKQLLTFAGNPKESMPKGLLLQLTDYLGQVDWTGRILREDK